MEFFKMNLLFVFIFKCFLKNIKTMETVTVKVMSPVYIIATKTASPAIDNIPYQRKIMKQDCFPLKENNTCLGCGKRKNCFTNIPQNGAIYGVHQQQLCNAPQNGAIYNVPSSNPVGGASPSQPSNDAYQNPTTQDSSNVEQCSNVEDLFAIEENATAEKNATKKCEKQNNQSQKETSTSESTSASESTTQESSFEKQKMHFIYLLSILLAVGFNSI